jgi:probable HAF family extracellular repeat protein
MTNIDRSRIGHTHSERAFMKTSGFGQLALTLTSSALLLGAAAVDCLGAPKPRYELTPILPLDPSRTVIPEAINNHGDVVGFVHWNDGEFGRPFLYRDGRLTVLDTGAANGDASDINDGGEFIIRLTDARNYLIKPDGQRILLSFGEAWFFSPSALNNRGEIAGATVNFNRGLIAATWSNGVVRTLGPNPSFALDINDSGLAAGAIYASPFSPISAAALLSPDGSIVVDNIPGGPSSMGVAINNAGDMVVNSHHADGSMGRTYLYTGGRLADLGMLKGHTHSAGTGINNLGHIVGASQSARERRAFIYADGTMEDLNHLIRPRTRLQLLVAYAINDNEQVIGVGQLGDGTPQAFLLTPK